MENNLFQIIRESLKGQYGDVVAAILPGGRVQGGEYVCASLAGGAGNSCKTNLRTGVGQDFATGEKWGDVIALAAQAWNKTPLDAAYTLAKQFGISVAKGGTFAKTKALPVSRPTPTVTEPAGTFTPIMPIPENAPLLPSNPPYTGAYCYRNAQGEELFYVLRYDEPNGGKTLRPVCYCADRAGNRQWCFKMPKEPRPLYGLDRLAKAAPDTPILLVEGEKTADAAQRLFPGCACMTWSGGSNAVALTDYSPIAGRDIVIWPDNDAPGLKAALNLLRCIEAENEKKEIPAEKAQIAPSRRIILPPENLPPKWDLADTPPDDFDPAEFLPHSLTPEEYAKALFSRHRDELGATALDYMIADDEEFDSVICSCFPISPNELAVFVIGFCLPISPDNFTIFKIRLRIAISSNYFTIFEIRFDLSIRPNKFAILDISNSFPICSLYSAHSKPSFREVKTPIVSLHTIAIGQS